MAYLTASNVGETTTTTGTGAISLTAALTGMRRFSDISGIAVNDVVPYTVFGVDGSGNRSGEWEYGIGTYSAANTLTRTTVLGSSNAGAAVNFSAGTKWVFLTPVGEQLIHRDQNGGLVNFESLIRADADRTLTSQTAAQAIFNSPTNGRLTLTTGTYLIDGLIHVNTMSATSGNAQFSLLGAGSATLGSQLFHIVGVDGAINTAATQTGSVAQASNTSAASAVTAGTATVMTMNIKGTFEVTTAGTVVPSIALVTAAAAVVKAGSYLSYRKIGSTSLVSIGAWD